MRDSFNKHMYTQVELSAAALIDHGNHDESDLRRQ